MVTFRPGCRLRTLLVVGAICGVLLVLLVVRAWWGIPKMWGTESTPSLEEVSRLVPIEFPASARIVQSNLHVFLGTTLLAKVEIDRSDVDSFIAALPSAEELSQTNRLDIGEAGGFVWWDPDSARDFIAARVEMGPTGEYRWSMLELLINMDDPQRAVVYLSWLAESGAPR